MNFVLLGDDPAALPLLRAVADHLDHRLTHAVEADGLLPQIRSFCPDVQAVSQWESVLASQSVEAVVLAGQEDSLLQGAKQCAAAGKPVVIFPHPAQDSAWFYEMTLVRDDAGALLFPALPLRIHPRTVRLLETLEEGEIGTLLYLQLEREVRPTDASVSPPMLSRADVDAALLRDANLLRSLGGDYDRLTALYSGLSGGRTAVATVTLNGDGLPEASWSLRPTTGVPNWSLRATGETGILHIWGEDGPSDLILERDGHRTSIEVESSEFDEGRELLDRFERAVRGEAIRPDWTDLTRDFETVEGASRSLRRGRTVDLYLDAASERGQFKTQMTALGCGVLVTTLLAILFLLLLGAMFDVNPAVMRILRWLLFVPLVLFLLMQLFVFVAKPSSEASRSGEDL